MWLGPGQAARLVDLSAGGALLEMRARLVPGATVELRVASPGHRWSLPAAVRRCAVWRLETTGVTYRGAVAFRDKFDLARVVHTRGE